MKKFFSLTFIAILLLNIMGYYGVFLGLQYRNDAAMLRFLDTNQYHESQTITINIPISIPYMNDNINFERVNGKFEHQGEHYRLVKQKYAKDTLIVVCVKDVENKRISEALYDYVETFSDTATNHNQALKVTVSLEYLLQVFSLKSVSSGWDVDIIQYAFHRHLFPSFIVSVVHPPDRA